MPGSSHALYHREATLCLAMNDDAEAHDEIWSLFRQCVVHGLSLANPLYTSETRLSFRNRVLSQLGRASCRIEDCY